VGTYTDWGSSVQSSVDSQQVLPTPLSATYGSSVQTYTALKYGVLPTYTANVFVNRGGNWVPVNYVATV